MLPGLRPRYGTDMVRGNGDRDGLDPDIQELVAVSRRGAVATVTLNRPERHNGLTRPLKQQLRDRLAEVAADTSVRAVVLTGAGRSFCVGQDLAEHAEALRGDDSSAPDEHHALDTVEEHYNPIVRSLITMPKPVVAAINGTCVGAGLGFAMACDLRVAVAGARFATAFTAIGLTMDSGLSATLGRAVGAARASELVLLGDGFDAETAASWGLVGQVASSDAFQSTVADLADRLAAGPTLAYAAAKAALAAAWNPPIDEVLAAEAIAQAALGRTADHRRAVEAFLAKAKPTFSGL
jgi:2-(1,2-epoxy-1,2-dihydrophenyl)acetyl-CoA isomerase